MSIDESAKCNGSKNKWHVTRATFKHKSIFKIKDYGPLSNCSIDPVCAKILGKANLQFNGGKINSFSILLHELQYPPSHTNHYSCISSEIVKIRQKTPKFWPSTARPTLCWNGWSTDQSESGQYTDQVSTTSWPSSCCPITCTPQSGISQRQWCSSYFNCGAHLKWIGSQITWTTSSPCGSVRLVICWRQPLTLCPFMPSP